MAFLGPKKCLVFLLSSSQRWSGTLTIFGFLTLKKWRFALGNGGSSPGEVSGKPNDDDTLKIGLGAKNRLFSRISPMKSFLRTIGQGVPRGWGKGSDIGPLFLKKRAKFLTTFWPLSEIFHFSGPLNSDAETQSSAPPLTFWPKIRVFGVFGGHGTPMLSHFSRAPPETF